MSDTKEALEIRAGELNTPLADGARPEAEKQFTDIFRVRKEADDAMAADATAEQYGFTFPYDGRITKIDIVTSADAAEDAADNATLTASKRDAAAGNKTTLGTYTTDTGVTGQGTLTAKVKKTLALTDTNLAVVEGGSFNWEIAKGGAGVVVPVLELLVYVLRQ